MNSKDVKTKCSIRGRVAFVLALSEKCIQQLRYSEKVFQLARKALEEAWKWEEGGKIDGDQLDYYLENEEEQSLAVYGCNPPEQSSAAIMAITSALAFVIWHAYKKDGITRMSSTIHEVNESVIDEVVGFALKSPGFDSTFIKCLAEYLVKHCGRSNPDELGSSITRVAVLGACK